MKRVALALLILLVAGCDDGGGSPDSSGGGGGGGLLDCGEACVLPNAVATCADRQCVVETCDPGFADPDGVAANGCECRALGVETCDGADQDCDGEVDEGLEGAACSECGVAACVGGATTCEEPFEVTPRLFLNDVGPPLEVEGAQPPAAAVGPDGALYVGAAGTPPRLWRVAPDGTATPVAVDADAPGDRPAFACTEAGCTFAWWRSDGTRPGFYFMPAAGGAVSFHGLGTDHQPAHDRAWLPVVNGVPFALVRFPNSGRVDVQVVPLDERSAPRTVLTRLMFGRARLLTGEGRVPALVEIAANNALALYRGIDVTGLGERVHDPVWTVNDAPDVAGFAEGDGWRLVWRSPAQPRLRTALLAADGAEIEAPRAEDWDVASLEAADNGESLWVAGAGGGPIVRYRRLARNGAWMNEVALSGAGDVNAVALAARDGAVWLVRNVSDAGARTLQVARYGGDACP